MSCPGFPELSASSACLTVPLLPLLGLGEPLLSPIITNITMLPSQITASIPQISSHKGPNGQWNWLIGFVVWINRWSPSERFGFRNHYSWDFPGDPVAKNPSSSVWDVSSTPGWGTKISYVVRQLNSWPATTEPSSSREPVGCNKKSRCTTVKTQHSQIITKILKRSNQYSLSLWLKWLNGLAIVPHTTHWLIAGMTSEFLFLWTII